MFIQLNKAEKETLEVKNEKMEAIIKRRDIEDHLRDCERDFLDREMQLRNEMAMSIRDLTNIHQTELRKLKTQFQIIELELMEERHGHEEHVKCTNQVLAQLHASMDSMKNPRASDDDVHGSLSSANL